MTRWPLALLLATGCLGGLDNNADGISSIEIRLPANFYLENGRPLTIRAVARNKSGDSVEAKFLWRTADSAQTIMLDSATGTITPLKDVGKAKIQVALLGKDSLISVLDSLTFTLTARADSTYLTSPDSIEARTDTSVATVTAKIEGGSPPTPVVGRPVTFAVVDPIPVDTALVAFPTGKARDSVNTGTTGTGSLILRPRHRSVIPDRVVVEMNAYRADGTKIPGSGRRIVIRYRHETP